MGAVRGSVASLAPTADRAMSSRTQRERYRSIRADGRDGDLLVIERQPTEPPPTWHPLTGEPLRRLWDCAPPDAQIDIHVVAP